MLVKLTSYPYNNMNQPAQTGIYLRRAMKLLGFTNKSLAAELTGIRMDGQKTAEATVSRWISGASPADPGTLLYLRERLVALAMGEAKPRLDRCRVIAVGGGKGGCGGSTMAAALTIAARDFGYRTCHATVSDACNNEYFTHHPAYDFDMVSPSDVAAADWRNYDFAFLDVPSKLYAYGGGLQKQIMAAVDLIVLPIDLCGLGVHSAVAACRALDDVPDCPPRMLVQCASLSSIEHIIEHIEQIQPWREALYHAPVYVEDPIEFKLGIRGTWEFTSAAAATAFVGLFEEGIGDRLDLGVPETQYSADRVRDMDLFELIDLVSERQGISRRH